MPVQLRNKSGQELFAAELNKTVAANELLEVPGDVVAQLDDAVVISGPQGERAWPKSSWSVVSVKKSTKDEE